MQEAGMLTSYVSMGDFLIPLARLSPAFSWWLRHKPLRNLCQIVWVHQTQLPDTDAPPDISTLLLTRYFETFWRKIIMYIISLEFKYWVLDFATKRKNIGQRNRCGKVIFAASVNEGLCIYRKVMFLQVCVCYQGLSPSPVIGPAPSSISGPVWGYPRSWSWGLGVPLVQVWGTGVSFGPS